MRVRAEQRATLVPSMDLCLSRAAALRLRVTDLGSGNRSVMLPCEDDTQVRRVCRWQARNFSQNEKTEGPLHQADEAPLDTCKRAGSAGTRDNLPMRPKRSRPAKGASIITGGSNFGSSIDNDCRHKPRSAPPLAKFAGDAGAARDKRVHLPSKSACGFHHGAPARQYSPDGASPKEQETV
jgi:hypothetical protein